MGIITEAAKILGKDAPSRARRFIRHGDVLFATIRPTLKRIARVTDTYDCCVCSTGYYVLRSSGEVDTGYLFYYLQTAFFFDRMEALQRGASYPAVSDADVRRQRIAYPLPPEQNKIVEILDQAFAGIDKAKAAAEQNLNNARELFDTTLNSIFTQNCDGWEEKKLMEVCEKITDGTHQTPTYFNEGVVFLSSKNVTSGKIDWINVKYIDKQQHVNMHKRVAPKMHDVLLAKNGTTGVAAMVDRDTVFDIYVSLALLRSLGDVLPKYLLYFVNSPVAKRQFNKRLKGVGVPNLHLNEIRAVDIFFPRVLAEQKKIVDRLNALSTRTKQLEAIYQKKIDALDELKKSILHKAFTGELTSDFALHQIKDAA